MSLRALLICGGLVLALVTAYFAGVMVYAPPSAQDAKNTLLERCVQLPQEDPFYIQACDRHAVRAWIVTEALLQLDDDAFAEYLQNQALPEELRPATYAENVLFRAMGTASAMSTFLADLHIR